MTISKTNIDTNDKRALYRMTRGESEKVQELHDGDVIAVENYCLYLDDKIDDKTGETFQQPVLTFTTQTGRKFGTISPSFIREFEVIVDLMDGEAFEVRILKRKSRNNREFITCELA